MTASVSGAGFGLLAVFFVLMVLLAWPLARWIDTVMAGGFAWGRRIEAPLYRLAGVDANAETPWLRGLATCRGEVMSGWDILGALLAAGLLVYLVFALLRPEDFS